MIGFLNKRFIEKAYQNKVDLQDYLEICGECIELQVLEHVAFMGFTGGGLSQLRPNCDEKELIQQLKDLNCFAEDKKESNVQLVIKGQIPIHKDDKDLISIRSSIIG